MRRWTLTRIIAIVGIAVVLIAPLWSGWSASRGGSFRDHFDVYTVMMGSPVGLVLPLVVALLTCLGLYRDLVARFAANTRARLPVRRYVALRFLAAGVSAAGIFFLYAFLPILASFVVWPLIGDPGIDPGGYNMTPAQAVTDSFGRTSYSFLLQYGDLTFGLVYAAWVAVAAATYAILGCGLLLALSHRILALAGPFLIYIASTVIAALAGLPQWGLLYSAFPAGLEASPPLEAAAPTLALIAVASTLAAVVVHRAPTNPRLA